ncbi:phosphopentomutase [bacterium]|nr:phosphopentomutase [bacterium]
MKRAFVIVIDSMGCGALSDAKEFGDTMECNTLGNVARFNHGLNIPNLQKLGLGNIIDVMGAPSVQNPTASYGIMKETSKGKCTTTGHWEMMGLVLDKPFQTFPNGFPKDIIEEFIEKTNCGGILANYPASGTKVIEDLHSEHEKTKFPIIYTSADSVFQIAVDIDIIPVETLYEWCRIARKILDEKTNVSRVIARPYRMIDGKPTRIGGLRRDYSVVPFKDTTCDKVLKNNGIVVGIGKIEDIFVKKGISHAIHTGSNKEGLELTLKAFNKTLNLDEIKVAPFSENYDREFIFTNLVDTDMLYGHRNDAKGYGKAIEEIDTYLPKFMENMTDDDLMIITADHGCDPTVAGTDHTREQVPVLVYSPSMKPQKLPEINCFDFVGKQVEKWLGC